MWAEPQAIPERTIGGGEDLAEAIARLTEGRGLDFYRSWRSQSARQERALFFYHCPKTAGSTVYAALTRGLKSVGAISEQGLFVGRLNDMDVPAGKKLVKPSAFIATHDHFGLHERIAQEFDLVTLVREPVARVASHYT